MPHGGPDWSTGGQIGTVHTIEDLGELAARLGSPVTFDRRGNVVFLEDFESGDERWQTEGDESADMGWSAERARNGGFCYKIETSKVSSANTGIHYKGSRPRLSSIGLEFSHGGGDDWNIMTARLRIYDGKYELNSWLRYHDATGVIDIYADGGFYIPIGTYKPPTTIREFYTIKLVADFKALKYKRLIANNQEIDLSSHTIYPVNNLTQQHMEIEIVVSSAATGIAHMHVDDIIVTQNEP